MKLRFSPLLLLALSLLLSSCSPGAEMLRPDQLSFPPLVFHPPEVERLELPNGIRLYLKEDAELPLLEVTAMIGAGSIGDPPGRTGEGMLYAAALRTGGAGSRSPDEVDRMLERLAADFSAGSDDYATTLELSLQSGDLDAGLGLLADVLLKPGFAPERLELARKQAIEGVRRQNDDPGSIASRALMKALYGDHPLGRTPTVETLSAVDRNDLLDFHRSYVHPDNLWLAISGDFDRAALLETLHRLFGDWPRVPFTPQAIPPLTGSPRGALLVAPKEIPQTTILLGEIGIDKSAPDQYAVRVMNYILGGGGFNSRLMSEIRSDRGLAYSVYSYYQIGRLLPGPFVAGCETKSASTVEVVQLMRRIMEEMRSEPVAEHELHLARESLVNSFIFAFDDSHDVVTQAMRLDYYGYPEGYLETFRDRVAAVTAADVLAAARARLHPETQTLVLVGDQAALEAVPAALGRPVEIIRDGE
ncbi:putative Zn-dependent peptidase [Desulfuromonas soudanensis]|uniref:Putative Zn-dependent peptidase n=1 Tax=Desulfuromonas soudanensis TaxID=1603606 RepID=A0A0M4DIL3_9BACT|nr:pitrilysin family protein [Desulfuromonas soudanensis]ALC17062.1 putative Zn-dependent peptidase [Desulfuromonas soudanensis]